MYIGSLLKDARLGFTHSGTDLPFAPDSSDKKYVWRWDSIYDSSVDLTYDLGKRCFIGAVQARISGASEICVLVDGAPVRLTGEVTPVALEGERVTLRIRGDLRELEVADVDVLGSFEDGLPLLFPTPKSYTQGEGRVRISSASYDGASPDEAFAHAFLYETLAERYGDITDPSGVPVTVRLSENGEYEGERYTVQVSEERIVITAGTRLGLLLAACRLADLICDGYAPVCKIDDKPTLPMRGFHMGLPRRDRFDFVKRLFRYVLLPLGYNHVIVEFNAAMRFDRHPEIAEGWVYANKQSKLGKQPPIAHGDMGAEGTALEKEDVRELLGYIADLGFEIIPEVQSLGHVQYITNVHPEIAELEVESRIVTDRRGEDERPDEFYPHTYCPSNEKSLQIIFDIIDEVIEVAKPKRYIHIGHDEIYQLSLCPLCKKKSRRDNYLGHILRLREYAKAQGLDVMIWSDMLHANMPYSLDTYSARDDLPRDVVLLDFTWYFHPGDDLEDDLLPLGFGVMIGNLYSSHFPRYSSRIKKQGMLGGEVSTWTAVSEEVFADNGKIFDLAYTAEMLHNPEVYDERNRRTYTRLIAKHIQPKHRDAIHGKVGFVGKTETVTLPKGSTEGIPECIRALLPEVRLAEGLSAELSGRCERLLIEGATLFSAPRLAWKPLTRLGEYTVVYTDGTEEKIAVNYAGNILRYDTHYAEPMPQMYYRHQGYVGTWYSDPTFESRTAEGEPVTFTSYTWYNPHPDRELSRIYYEADGTDTCKVLLKSLKLVR